MQTVIITGANRGIGLALTRRFAVSDCRVIATCRQPDHAKQLTKLAQTNDVVPFKLDVTNAQQVEALVAKVGNEKIDILINNAGTIGGQRQSSTDMDYDNWREAFEINTLAPFRLATAIRPNLRLASNPRIITISSQMGALSRKSTGSFAYRSSKAAVNKVMQVLALELKPDGIVVCPFHPGWVRTDMGGPQGEISAEESAESLFEQINALTLEHSGRFWTWQGDEHDW